MRTVKFTTDEEIVERLDSHRSRYVTRTRLIETAVIHYLGYLDSREERLHGVRHDV